MLQNKWSTAAIRGVAACVLAAPLGMAGASRADVVLLADGFGDGDRDNDSVLEGAVQDAGDVGAVWYRARGSSSSDSPAVSIIDDGSGLGAGNALAVSPGSTSARHLVAGFNEVTLTNVGDAIAVQFDFRLNSLTPPVGDRRIRFGLYHDGGTPITADFQGNDSSGAVLNDDNGIMAQLDTGADGGTTADLRWEAAGDAPLGGTTDSFGASTTEAGAAMDNAKHTILLTLTLVGVDDILSVLTIDGTEYISRQSSQGAVITTSSFNEFLIAQNGLDVDYVIDNVQVTSIPVPEPGSLALLGLGGLLAARRTRD